MKNTNSTPDKPEKIKLEKKSVKRKTFESSAESSDRLKKAQLEYESQINYQRRGGLGDAQREYILKMRTPEALQKMIDEKKNGENSAASVIYSPDTYSRSGTVRNPSDSRESASPTMFRPFTGMPARPGTSYPVYSQNSPNIDDYYSGRHRMAGPPPKGPGYVYDAGHPGTPGGSPQQSYSYGQSGSYGGAGTGGYGGSGNYASQCATNFSPAYTSFNFFNGGGQQMDKYSGPDSPISINLSLSRDRYRAAGSMATRTAIAPAKIVRSQVQKNGSYAGQGMHTTFDMYRYGAPVALLAFSAARAGMNLAARGDRSKLYSKYKVKGGKNASAELNRAMTKMLNEYGINIRLSANLYGTNLEKTAGQYMRKLKKEAKRLGIPKSEIAPAMKILKDAKRHGASTRFSRARKLSIKRNIKREMRHIIIGLLQQTQRSGGEAGRGMSLTGQYVRIAHGTLRRFVKFTKGSAWLAYKASATALAGQILAAKKVLGAEKAAAFAAKHKILAKGAKTYINFDKIAGMKAQKAKGAAKNVGKKAGNRIIGVTAKPFASAGKWAVQKIMKTRTGKRIKEGFRILKKVGHVVGTPVRAIGKGANLLGKGLHVVLKPFRFASAILKKVLIGFLALCAVTLLLTAIQEGTFAAFSLESVEKKDRDDLIEYINKLYNDDMDYVLSDVVTCRDSKKAKNGDITKIDDLTFEDNRSDDLYEEMKKKIVGDGLKDNDMHFVESSNCAEIMVMAYIRFDMDFDNAEYTPASENGAVDGNGSAKDNTANPYVKKGMDAVKAYVKELWYGSHSIMISKTAHTSSAEDYVDKSQKGSEFVTDAGAITTYTATVTYTTDYFNDIFNDKLATERQVTTIDADAQNIIDGYDFTGGSAEDICYYMLRKAGFTHEGACGVMGNIQQESSFEPSNGTGSYYGLFQLGQDRLANMKKFAEGKGLDPASVPAQMGFTLKELTGNGHNFKALLSKLKDKKVYKDEKGAVLAANDWCVVYERCVGGSDAYSGTFPDRAYKTYRYQNLDERVKYAKGFYKKYLKYKDDYEALGVAQTTTQASAYIKNGIIPVDYLNWKKGWYSATGKTYSKKNFTANIKGKKLNKIGDSLCAASMAISYAANGPEGKRIDPKKFADLLFKNGKYQGPSDTFAEKAAKKYKLTTNDLNSKKSIISALKKGDPVIARMEPDPAGGADGKTFSWGRKNSKGTKVASYVVLVGLSDKGKGDKIAVLDPTDESKSYVIDKKVFFSATAMFSDEDNVFTEIVASMTAGVGKGAAIVKAAESKMGCKYVWGAAGPNTFDCSGLVWWAHNQVGIKFGRTDTTHLAGLGKAVDRSELLPGDVLLFSSNGSSSGIHHTGIYIGGGKMVHAPHTGDVVKITQITSGYYAQQFYCARRLWT